MAIVLDAVEATSESSHAVPVEPVPLFQQRLAVEASELLLDPSFTRFRHLVREYRFLEKDHWRSTGAQHRCRMALAALLAGSRQASTDTEERVVNRFTRP